MTTGRRGRREGGEEVAAAAEKRRMSIKDLAMGDAVLPNPGIGRNRLAHSIAQS